jgi:hypothetical protein
VRLVGGQRHCLPRLQAQVVEEPGGQHAHVPGVLQLQAQRQQLARGERPAGGRLGLQPRAHAVDVGARAGGRAGHHLVECGLQRGVAARGGGGRGAQRGHARRAAALCQLGHAVQRSQQLVVGAEGAERLELGDGQRHLGLVVVVLVHL